MALFGTVWHWFGTVLGSGTWFWDMVLGSGTWFWDMVLRHGSEAWLYMGPGMAVYGSRHGWIWVLAWIYLWVGPWQYPPVIPTLVYPPTRVYPCTSTVPSMLYLGRAWDTDLNA